MGSPLFALKAPQWRLRALEPCDTARFYHRLKLAESSRQLPGSRVNFLPGETKTQEGEQWNEKLKWQRVYISWSLLRPEEMSGQSETERYRDFQVILMNLTDLVLFCLSDNQHALDPFHFMQYGCLRYIPPAPSSSLKNTNKAAGRYLDVVFMQPIYS